MRELSSYSRKLSSGEEWYVYSQTGFLFSTASLGTASLTWQKRTRTGVTKL